ncbi:hypothetical protein [Thermoactinomyces sp. CICC 10735]|nr:hypothetical protein [Thermoactinomyces sp. CICC 10735]
MASSGLSWFRFAAVMDADRTFAVVFGLALLFVPFTGIIRAV